MPGYSTGWRLADMGGARTNFGHRAGILRAISIAQNTPPDRFSGSIRDCAVCVMCVLGRCYLFIKPFFAIMCCEKNA